LRTIARIVNKLHEAIAVVNISHFKENVIDSNIKFNGKFMIVPTAVSLIASIHASRDDRFIHLTARINQFVPVYQGD